MKVKRINKKLVLNKSTMANLSAGGTIPIPWSTYWDTHYHSMCEPVGGHTCVECPDMCDDPE